jgi:hypothetical protein
MRILGFLRMGRRRVSCLCFGVWDDDYDCIGYVVKAENGVRRTVPLGIRYLIQLCGSDRALRLDEIKNLLSEASCP